MRALAMAIFGLLLVDAVPAAAQPDPCAGGLASARIIDCLRPGGPTRGIRPAAPAAPSVAAPGATVTQPGPARLPRQAASVDLTVPFAFDSAELTGPGIAALGALATALKDPALAGARFRLVGHTDAKGTDAYNQALSERRAAAAQRYLVERAGIDAARLAAIGLGRTELYDPLKPAAASNRRVQVIRLDN